MEFTQREEFACQPYSTWSYLAGQAGWVQQHENTRRRNPEADKFRRESRISEVSWSSAKMRREYERHNEVYSRSFIGRHDDPAGYQRRSSRRLLRALHREPRCIGLLTGERELHGDSMPNRERYVTWETTTFTTWAIAEDAVQEWTAGTLSIQATFPNDALEKTAENVLIGGAEATEEAGKIGEAVSIAGVMRRDGSDRLAEERMESAAAVRTAATSWFTEEALSHARSLRVARKPQSSQRKKLAHSDAGISKPENKLACFPVFYPRISSLLRNERPLRGSWASRCSHCKTSLSPACPEPLPVPRWIFTPWNPKGPFH